MKNGFARRITAICLFAAILMIPASTSFSQDFTTSVGQGAKAMLFSFSGLSVLGANEFDGGIGAKYYIMDPLALRVAIPFSYANQSIPANAAPGLVGTDGSTSAVRFGLAVAAEYHLLKTRVSPYVGGGLGFSNTSTKAKTAVVAPATQSIMENRATGETIGGNAFVAGTAFNVGALAGVEFFIVRELSLSAEYQLGYSMTARADQKLTTAPGATPITTKEGTLSQFGIAAAGVLTLSVYF
jgi:opacity protein-like surface antigen